MTKIDVGDVLLIRNPSNFFSRLIRLGSALRDRSNRVNHVAIVHHVDPTGTVWAIEGRPGGVGWVNANLYLANRRTVTNAAQPKTPEQRYAVGVAAEAMVGTPYDWPGIARDAMQALGLEQLWPLHRGWKQPPEQVVCSSLAAWVYDQVDLGRPPGEAREVTPGDWDDYLQAEGWEL